MIASLPPVADAVLLPRGWARNAAGATRAADQHKISNAAFGPAVGAKALWWIDVPGGKLGVACTGHRNARSDLKDASLLLPTGHPNKGHDRFAWYWCRMEGGRPVPMGRLDGPGDAEHLDHPKLGYLLPDEAAGDPAIEAAKDERAQQLAAEIREGLRIIMQNDQLREAFRAGRPDLDDRQFDGYFGRFA